MKTESASPQLTWKDLKKINFRGGTAEIFRDCSFDDICHQHIRVTITTVSWRNGKPYFIRYTAPVEFIDNGTSPKIVWKTPEPDYWLWQGYFNCQHHFKNAPLLGFGAFKDIWQKNGGYTFKCGTGAGITLYPPGTKLPERPFFHETEEDRKEFRKMFSRVFGAEQ